MSAAELEEIALPDFGFDRSGRLEFAVGSAVAVLSITESGALQMQWRGHGDQKLVAAVPDVVKRDHARELKTLRLKAKEIDQTLRAQRLRLEDLYLAERVLSVGLWRERYLEQPLVAGLARRLIWSFEIGGRWIAALPRDAELVDAAGKRLAVAPSARVKLWHPMQSKPMEVLAWRRRLQSFRLTQPCKQAHREIYVLTQAEQKTRIYSNRFAGHIVDQHRFRALCQARGWNCPMFGGWDSDSNGPLKRLADRELRVEFHVEPIEPADEHSTLRHLSTDQIRFTSSSGEPVRLVSVDPVLFSEAMRDADLFVSVAGIASDATWSDRGVDLGGYWARAAFGELIESGKTRHAVLKDLLPGLSIAAQCRLDEKYLVVKGKLSTYRIHLGSGNIQMEPNSQYLCIVPDRAKADGGIVHLPFEGDGTLSIILSKAFMLVDDDKIKDASIRSQILRRDLSAR